MYPPPGFFMPMPPPLNGQVASGQVPPYPMAGQMPPSNGLPYPPLAFFPNPQGGGFLPYPFPFMMPPPPAAPNPPANEGEIGIFEVNSNGSIDNDPLINFYKGSAQANVETWNLAQDQDPGLPSDTYEKPSEPLETIFEDVGEYIDASSAYIRRPRSESRPKTAKPSKARDADAYL